MSWPVASDIVDPDTWSAAYRSARSHPGMGSIKLEFHPYECEWICDINYSDNTHNKAQHADVNEALRLATEANEAYWQARRAGGEP